MQSLLEQQGNTERLDNGRTLQIGSSSRRIDGDILDKLRQGPKKSSEKNLNGPPPLISSPDQAVGEKVVKVKKKKKSAVVDQIYGETVAEQTPDDQIVISDIPVDQVVSTAMKLRLLNKPYVNEDI